MECADFPGPCVCIETKAVCVRHCTSQSSDGYLTEARHACTPLSTRRFTSPQADNSSTIRETKLLTILTRFIVIFLRYPDIKPSRTPENGPAEGHRDVRGVAVPKRDLSRTLRGPLIERSTSLNPSAPRSRGLSSVATVLSNTLPGIAAFEDLPLFVAINSRAIRAPRHALP